MEKLNWNYSERENYRFASYRGLELRAIQDDSPSNPLEDFDGEAPTAVYSDRHNSESDYSDGTIFDPVSELPESRFTSRKGWADVAKALGLTGDSFTESREEYPADNAADARRYYAADRLRDMKPDYYTNAGDYTRALEALWRMAGVPALAWVSRGYSQGDYADGITVATPAWRKAMGIEAKLSPADLEGTGKLWGAWAWGDVYGYVIMAAGEDLDSCWGYYGEDLEESGLEEAATSAADYILAAARKARAAKALELVKARVPLALRPSILEAAGELRAAY